MTFEIGVTSPELQNSCTATTTKKGLLLTEFANYHKEYVKPAFQEETSDSSEMLSREHFVQNTDRKIARKAHNSC